MCGILALLCADASEVRLASAHGITVNSSGVVTGNIPDADFVKSLGARQAHRGPDAQAVLTGPGWALAHQRLSIMDPREVTLWCTSFALSSSKVVPFFILRAVRLCRVFYL